MKILISGGGVAGPTLAYWLKRYGFTPTLVEKSPRLRTGGYVIDFWGLGFDVAEKMGLLPQLRKVGYKVKEVRMVGKDGQKVSGFSAEVFTRITHDHYISLLRGDLAAAIYRSLNGEVETIFDDEISAIHDIGNVEFKSGLKRNFDLVIGADGLHSKVREIKFGPESRYERFLGYNVAAFEARGYRPRDEDVYMMYTEVGRQIARFSMRDDRTMFLFVFAEDKSKEIQFQSGSPQRDLAGQKRLIREYFSEDGWEIPGILRELDKAEEIYFDRVSQIRMDDWSCGRVALLGDAAYCVSLLAGQGSALAMAGAYILAGELKAANGDYSVAFRKYQELLRDFIAKKQKGAEKFAGAFAPRTRLGLFLRNQIAKTLAIPLIADWAIGRDLQDKLELPNYD